MTESGNCEQVATNELMFLHVGLAAERVKPIPPASSRAVRLLAAAHASPPAPPNASRRIRMPGR